MKICISKSTYDSFKSDFDNNCHGDEFILLDSDGEVDSGDGRPDIAFISYELMFKSIRSKEFFNKYLDLINGSSFVQGSWAGIETKEAQELIKNSKSFCHGGGIHAIPIATYIFAQMLRSIKSIDEHIDLQKNKDWTQMTSVGELTEMTIGITGFGGIGQEVARIAKAFRMKVLATKRTPVSSDNLDRLFRPTELNDMIVDCDFVVIWLPAFDETF